jgi:hypothetical protein
VIRVRAVDSKGFWVTAGRWDIAYWTPWTYQPFSVRNELGERCWRGRWGALRVTRR